MILKNINSGQKINIKFYVITVEKKRSNETKRKWIKQLIIKTKWIKMTN